MKKFLNSFFSLWVQILFLSIPLYILLWLNWIPVQLFSYIKVTIVVIAIISWFKGIRFIEIFTRKNKRLLYSLVSEWIIIFIGGFIIFNIFSVKKGEKLNDSEFINKQGIYFSQEGILYYFNNFPNKIGFDFNKDGFVDIKYDAKKDSWEESNYDVIGWILWSFVVLFLIYCFKERLKVFKKQVMNILILIIFTFYLVFGNFGYCDWIDEFIKCKKNGWNCENARQLRANYVVLYELCMKDIEMGNKYSKNCRDFDRILKQAFGLESKSKESIDLTLLDYENLSKICVNAIIQNQDSDLVGRCKEYVSKLNTYYLRNLCMDEYIKLKNYKGPICNLYRDRLKLCLNEGQYVISNGPGVNEEGYDFEGDGGDVIDGEWKYGPPICILTEEDFEKKHGFISLGGKQQKKDLDVRYQFTSKDNGEKIQSQLKESKNIYESKRIKKKVKLGQINKKLRKLDANIKNISKDLQNLQEKMNKLATTSKNPIPPKEIEFLLTYKKQITATKEFVEFTKKTIEVINEVYKEYSKQGESIIEAWNNRRDLAIWKRYILNEEYKIHKVLKENAKYLDEYMKEVKFYSKKARQLQKDIEQLESINEATKSLKEEAEDIVNKYKNIGKILKVIDKLQIGIDTMDLKAKAADQGVVLDTTTAVVAATANNITSNAIGDNPYDIFMRWVGHNIEQVGKAFDLKKIENIGKELKEHWTIGGEISQFIEYAVTTDEKTFEDMKEQYDRIYQEETKNAGILKKSVAFLKYKVVGKAYYRGVRGASKAIKGSSKFIKWASSLVNKVKSWF